MVFAIISDIHANASALRRVLEDARINGAEKVVCLGDIVGYGPLPEETINLAKESCDVVLAGNHDDAVTGKMDTRDFTGLAGDAIARHREVISANNRKWLATLPYVFQGNGFIASHGDFTEPSKFYYVDDENDAAANFSTTVSPLLFVGHTHVSGLFVIGESGIPHRLEPTDFTLEDNKRYIVNPGSVGYPREQDGICRSSYVLFDSEQRTVTFHFLPFTVSSVMQRGKQRQKKTITVLALALSAVLAGFGAFLALHRESHDTAEERIASLLIATKTLPVKPGQRAFRANLTLKDHSAPVSFSYVFRDADGREIKSDAKTVTRSFIAKTPIRVGTRTIDMKVSKVKPSDSPAILTFAPTLEDTK